LISWNEARAAPATARDSIRRKSLTDKELEEHQDDSTHAFAVAIEKARPASADRGSVLQSAARISKKMREIA
jgi:hypothetical protein